MRFLPTSGLRTERKRSAARLVSVDTAEEKPQNDRSAVLITQAGAMAGA